MSKVKSFTAKIKAAVEDDSLQEGEIVAYAAIFGNVDSYGDVIVKGAFEKTLTEWRASGDVIPLLWGHDMASPESNIGGVVEAREDDRGLRIRARLDIEDNPRALQVYKLVKGRRVRDLSFAFDAVDCDWVERDGQDVCLLKEVTLYECSIVPIGANPETEIVAVKQAAIDAQNMPVSDVQKERLISLREELLTAVKAIDGALVEPQDVVAETQVENASDEQSPLEPDVAVGKAAVESSVSSLAARLVNLL